MSTPARAVPGQIYPDFSLLDHLSLVESFRVLKYFHSDATPALLCHKEPAQGTLKRVFFAFLWFFIA